MEHPVRSVLAVPYASLINAGVIKPAEEGRLTVDGHFLRFCMVAVLATIQLDEQWYVKKYPDIQDAIDRSLVTGAAAHYLNHGYFENRIPYYIQVDSEWYIEQYPDVGEAILRLEFSSAQEHFETAGYSEGRVPYPNFVLRLAAAGDLPNVATEPNVVLRPNFG